MQADRGATGAGSEHGGLPSGSWAIIIILHCFLALSLIFLAINTVT